MRVFKDAGNVDIGVPGYPDGKIRDNDGSRNGTPVNDFTKGDIHQTFLKAKRLYGITENGLPDNELTGFQMLDSLIALASKNDFILPLSTSSGILNVPVKLGFMLTNESIVLKSTINVGAQTAIKGLDASTFIVTFVGTIKTNEYVRLIKTASGVTLVRLVDSVNIDLAVSEKGYLKKASQSEEDAGTSDIVATTPLVNKTTFAKRVTGSLSDPFKATQIANGLMSKEDKVKLDNFASNVKNIGYISGIDVGALGSLTFSGDVFAATVASFGGGSTTINVQVTNDLINTDYFVRMSVQSMSVSVASDTSILTPVFRIINSFIFSITIKETASGVQNLRIHFETVKI